MLLINGVVYRVQFQDSKGWPLRAASDRGQRFSAECTLQEGSDSAQERVAGTLLPSPHPVRAGWLEGYLAKRSGLAFQGWRVRWVELELATGRLMYYEHSRSSRNGDSPTGTVDLKGAGRQSLKRVKSLPDCHGMAFCFEIINDKEHVFSAISFAERSTWMDAVAKIVTENLSSQAPQQAAAAPRGPDSGPAMAGEPIQEVSVARQGGLDVCGATHRESIWGA